MDKILRNCPYIRHFWESLFCRGVTRIPLCSGHGIDERNQKMDFCSRMKFYWNCPYPVHPSEPDPGCDMIQERNNQPISIGRPKRFFQCLLSGSNGIHRPVETEIAFLPLSPLKVEVVLPEFFLMDARSSSTKITEKDDHERRQRIA
ncbi:hypothetical protein M5K25_028229 [Dendrobium thyrsiflorum]|uniref:Uncharacterized protein n=1 Tax=Dendrobium thyrsiflorum TaxID=117978 RepID=A0ABD0TTT8_DENTH